MKTINFFLIIVCIIIQSQSQVTQEWVNRYNGSGDQGDYGTAIVTDNLGNIIVTGYAWGLTSKQDYVTIKYNTAGTQQWVAIYDGPADTSDYAEDVFVDNNRNIYVTGWSYGVGSAFDYATIKYDANGVQQWVARYNGPGNQNDVATKVLVDASGNVYVTGYSVGNGTNIDFATIKYNSNGVQQWVTRYNDPNSNYFDVAMDMVLKNGFLYVLGYSNKINTGYDYETIKYNAATGDSIWHAVYNDPTNGDDFSNSICIDNSENVYVTGYGRITSSDDYITVKYNSSGVQQWVASYDGPAGNSDRTFSMALDNQSNVYVTGYSYGISSGQDWATVKYNTNGVQQWVQRVAASGSYADVPYKMVTDANNNIYVTGNSAIPGFSFDYFTVKYNPNGDSVWTARYNGPGNGNDIAQSIALDSSGNVFVTGYSRHSSSFGSEDIVTIKYSQVTGIKKLSNDLPSSFELFQNYPNPFNPKTIIIFSIPKTEKVQLIVYDVMGHEVSKLVNNVMAVGKYDVEFDASMFSSGVYFYKIDAGTFRDVKKMILVK